MKTKHTKGDWFFALDGCVYSQIDGDAQQICTLKQKDIFLSEEDKANGAMLATSKEMYDFIQSLPLGGWPKLIKAREELLAKARGQ
ncbi:hypothetical protein ACGRSR_18005 [Vibrio owensii]|uniref:hypothetical protein n=1 Tax=Vibrio owensii TaxID=696485 RepID=UPI003748C2FC